MRRYKNLVAAAEFEPTGGRTPFSFTDLKHNVVLANITCTLALTNEYKKYVKMYVETMSKCATEN